MIALLLLAVAVFFASRMNLQHTLQNLLKYAAIILAGLVLLGVAAQAINSLVGLDVLFSAALLNAVAYYYYLIDRERDVYKWWIQYALLFVGVSIISLFIINLFAQFVREDYESTFAYLCLFFVASAFPGKMIYAFFKEYDPLKTSTSKKPDTKHKTTHVRPEQKGQTSYYDIMGTTPEEVKKQATKQKQTETEETLEEAFSQYQENKSSQPSEEERQLSFYFDSDKGEIAIERATEGVLWTGSAGAGKTKSGIVPCIYQTIKQGGAGLIYDRKGELADHINAARMIYEPQLDFKYINFADLSRSHRCNPLRYMRNSTDAQAYALVILKNLSRSKQGDSFWEDTAFSVLASTMWYLKKHHSKFCTIPHLIAFLVSTPIETVVDILKSDMETRIMFSGVEKAQGSEKTITLIWSSVLVSLSKIATRENFYLLSGDEVDLTVNHQQNGRVITVSSFPEISQHQSVAPLIALIINASYSTMYAKESENRLPTLLQLDEFPTIYLHKFNEVPATIRSSGVCTMLGIQTLPQLIEMFGQNEAKAIIDNLSYQFYGKINNEETTRKVSQLVGDHDVRMKVTSKSQGRSRGDFQILGSSNKSTNESETIQRRQIIESQEVRALQQGQFITLRPGQKEAPVVQFDKPNYRGIQLDRIRDVEEKDIQENFEIIHEEASMIYTDYLNKKVG